MSPRALVPRVLLACARDDGPSGSSSAKLITPDNLQTIFDSPSYGPSAAYVPKGNAPAAVAAPDEQIVVTYDRASFDQTREPGGPPAPGWSVLSCAGGLDCTAGPTFTTTCNFDPHNSAACNGGTNVSAPPNFQHWLGRGTVAAEGTARVANGPQIGNRNVVYVGLVDTDGNISTAEKVALVVSNDGGTTFARFGSAQTIVVNQAGAGCDGGAQDFPNVTFDNTVDPPLGVVVWRNKQHNSFGGCMQEFFIDSSGNPQLIGQSVGIDNMDRAGGGVNQGQGYLKVLAADGVITVIYSNDDSLGDHECPDTTKTNIAWGAVNTFNGGAKWSKHTHIVETNDFVWCADGATVQRGLKEYDAALGPDGNLFFIATTAEGQARLFMSALRGASVRDSDLPDDSTWREFCPTASTGPHGRWLQTGQHCATAAFNATSIIRPTLGFDTNARLLVGFYQPAATGGTALQWFLQAITTPRAALVGTSDLQNAQPTDAPFTLGPQDAIDYVPYQPPPFADLTSANGLGWQNAIVAGGAMMPFPQGRRRFFPFWTQAGRSAGGVGQNQAVQTVRVDFTPAQ